MTKTPTPSELRDAVGISMSYASMILAGTRSPALPVAMRIFAATGLKCGPIASATDDQIKALSGLHFDHGANNTADHSASETGNEGEISAAQQERAA